MFVVVVRRSRGRRLVAMPGMIGRMGVHDRMGPVRMIFVPVVDVPVVVVGVGMGVMMRFGRRVSMVRVLVRRRFGVSVLNRMSMAVVVPVDLGRRGGMAGFGMDLVAMARIVGMLVVRLVLVAHGDPIPQPLPAVFQRRKAV